MLNQKHDELILWSESILKAQGYEAKAEYKTIQENPWSSVLKIVTTNNIYYLKQTPKNLFIEPEIIQAIHDRCHFNKVPEVVAVNNKLYCFLMRECGDVSLRSYFDGKFQPEIFIESIKTYKDLQKSTEAHVDYFIEMGVPDWRLQNFSVLYKDLLNNIPFLKSENVSDDLVLQLKKCEPYLENICDELLDYNLKDSLNHSDFHDNNIIVSLDSKKIAIVDLGETAIDHPFFSLNACLSSIVNRYNLNPDSPDYIQLKAAIFAGYQLPPGELQTVLKLIDKLFPIYLTFAHMRLVLSTPANALSSITHMNNRIKQGLEWFLKLAEAKH